MVPVIAQGDDFIDAYPPPTFPEDVPGDWVIIEIEDEISDIPAAVSDNQPDCNKPFAGQQTLGTYYIDDRYGPIYSVYSVAQTTGGYDVLIMQGATNSSAPTAAGTFNLESTGGFATIAFTGCSDLQGFPNTCANAYMTNRGTLTATALSPGIGGTFAGNLSAVTMVPSAQLPVSGTGTYCFSSFNFNATFEDHGVLGLGGGPG